MIRMDVETKSKRELEENPHALLRIYVRTRAPAGQWESEKWKCRENSRTNEQGTNVWEFFEKSKKKELGGRSSF